MAGSEGKKHVRFAAPAEVAGPRLPSAPHGKAVGGGWRGGDGAALRWCISGALCAAFLGQGMSIAVLGPTFQNLATDVNKNVSDIYYIFVGRSLGYLGGSVLGGMLFDCMNAHLLLALSMLATTVGLYGIPWCKKSLLLTVLMSVIEGSMGILDTGGNVLALNTWGAEAGPHMQALHFCFALGAFVAPILAKMALGGSESKELPVVVKTNQSAPVASAASALKRRLGADFLWSYAVIGTYLLLVSFLFFTLYSRGSSARDQSQACLQKRVPARYHCALIGLLSLLLSCCAGAEAAFGSCVFTHARLLAGMRDSEAAALNSAFWGTFTACRAAAMFCAACLYPGTMILLGILGSVLSSSCLAFFAGQPAALWVGSAAYGASLAAIIPSGVSWAGQHTAVRGRAAAVFVVSAALGEMCVPAAVGYLQGRVRRVPVVMYSAMATSALMALLFPLMYKLANCPRQSSFLKEASESEDRLALLSDSRPNEDEEDEEDVGEWNEADFEVIEMNDTLRNPVIETSRKIPGDSPAEVSLQHHMGDVLHSSPVAAGFPGRKAVIVRREKND
ncbi:MFS4B protein, partial [Alcedo cyanopectus]|nr:MFS4B protein [Ceyx cyanopectus]